MSDTITITKTVPSESPKAQTVLIATPTIDGKLDAWYVNSLCDTLLLCAAKNIFVKPIFLAYESILPMARNECFKIAYDGNFSDMIFIDSDIGWNPEAFLEIVLAKEPVIGLPCRLKTDDAIVYNLRLDSPANLIKNDVGYMKVVSIGTGFLKISRPAIESLWNSNISINFKNKQLKNICEYNTSYSDFIGEDVTICNKIKELGYDVWVNPKNTCMHIGNKIYIGDFMTHFAAINTKQA